LGICENQKWKSMISSNGWSFNIFLDDLSRMPVWLVVLSCVGCVIEEEALSSSIGATCIIRWSFWMITDVSMVYFISLFFCKFIQETNLFLLIPKLMYSLPFDLSISFQIFQVRLCSIRMKIVISWKSLTAEDAPW